VRQHRFVPLRTTAPRLSIAYAESPAAACAIVAPDPMDNASSVPQSTFEVFTIPPMKGAGSDFLRQAGRAGRSRARI